ncbi:MAG: hypothetical protein OEY79_04600, partial [Anaplasmataceae bacterium]|nr:hypothetical protein [Anaplasmataceae bacterium]
DKKVELNTKVELNAKAELNVASNNLSGNLSPKVDIKDVNVRDNSFIRNDETHNHVPGENVVNNDFHSPCKEGEHTCISYDANDRPNDIRCKPNDENC